MKSTGKVSKHLDDITIRWSKKNHLIVCSLRSDSQSSCELHGWFRWECRTSLGERFKLLLRRIIHLPLTTRSFLWQLQADHRLILTQSIYVKKGNRFTVKTNKRWILYGAGDSRRIDSALHQPWKWWHWLHEYLHFQRGRQAILPFSAVYYLIFRDDSWLFLSPLRLDTLRQALNRVFSSRLWKATKEFS